MVQPSHPIYYNVVVSFCQDLCGHYRGPGHQTAEFEEAWEDWQICGQAKSVWGLLFEEVWGL